MPQDPTPQPSDTDSGLFSLSQIMHLMRVEFGRAQRYNYPICCVLLAVDRLAELRDLYGYDAKEAILDEVVKLTKTQVRLSDFLGRLADDRLLIVVPHTDATGAKSLAERLIGGVRELKFESDGRRLRVTLSLGVTCSTGNDMMFFDALLASAEAALVEAMRAGGDRSATRDPRTISS
jgi:diguanylate cyclase (GGDEF)-like protein